ncbi:MAG: hypothetical protein ACU83U_09145 [Gammaproteobacteria bacterium]
MRHQQLVLEHLSVTDTLSADFRSLLNKSINFVGTQADWRFYKNASYGLHGMGVILRYWLDYGYSFLCCIH